MKLDKCSCLKQYCALLTKTRAKRCLAAYGSPAWTGILVSSEDPPTSLEGARASSAAVAVVAAPAQQLAVAVEGSAAAAHPPPPHRVPSLVARRQPARPRHASCAGLLARPPVPHCPPSM